MADNIVLTGFMGVGKGRVGRTLAQATSLFVVDCDDLIESAFNMKIRKIFQVYGEEVFRIHEKRTARWLEENVSRTIISTGGGFINVPNLGRIGTIIYLHAEFSDIVANLMAHPNASKKIKKRPLLQDMEKAEKLHASRVPLYRNSADVEVAVTGLTEWEVAEALIERCALQRTDSSFLS